MTTSTGPVHPAAGEGRAPLRLLLRDSGERTPHGRPDGAWWPQSRSLQVEGADLVDHFPASVSRVQRLLFSPPDWDDARTDGKGTRRITAGRGAVKVGSFPSDDTHRMVLTLADGRRLSLLVVPSGTGAEEAAGTMRAALA